MNATKWIIYKIHALSEHLLPIYTHFKPKQQSTTSLMDIRGLESTNHSYIFRALIDNNTCSIDKVLPCINITLIITSITWPKHV